MQIPINKEIRHYQEEIFLGLNLRQMICSGAAITAGQVIGYVGNTGDSTGFHLHFEVMQNGLRVNPMDMVCPQEKKQ